MQAAPFSELMQLPILAAQILHVHGKSRTKAINLRRRDGTVS
jgi:hypothetical protein